MARGLVEESSLIALADAIRNRTGRTDGLVFPEGFIAATGDVEQAGYDRAMEETQPIVDEQSLLISQIREELADAVSGGREEWWDNDAAVQKYYWAYWSGRAYAAHRMDLPVGRYRLTVEENYCTKDDTLYPEKIHTLYIGPNPGTNAGNFLFANSGTPTKNMSYEFEVAEGDMLYFSTYPPTESDFSIIFTELLVGLSLKRIGGLT